MVSERAGIDGVVLWAAAVNWQRESMKAAGMSLCRVIVLVTLFIIGHGEGKMESDSIWS